MDKIKIAVDSCIVIMLSKLASENLNEKDKAVIECLKSKTLTPDLYKDTPKRFLPSLLKDKYFGAIEEGEDGKKYYSNLMDIYRLLDRVQRGIVELYITPSVFGELDFEYYEDQAEFIKQYVNVIQVKREDAKVFYSKRGLLAREYVEKGAMLEQYDASQRKRVPQNDAFIMAEASLCGLMLVTANNKDFINATKWKDDYKRADIINEVNADFGLVFTSNIEHFKITPHPLSVNSFVMKSRFSKKNCTKGYYIPNPKLAENTYQEELGK